MGLTQASVLFRVRLVLRPSRFCYSGGLTAGKASSPVPRGEVVCLWGNELNNFDSRGWFYMLLLCAKL
ncbi:hypothetical protein YC2023_021319 [Brassica napus]